MLAFAGMDEAVFVLFLDTFACFTAAERPLTRSLDFVTVLVFPGTALAHLFNLLHFPVSLVVFPLWRRLLPLRCLLRRILLTLSCSLPARRPILCVFWRTRPDA